jgi:hypothetical protein
MCVPLHVITAVLKLAIDQSLTPSVVMGGFKTTGMFPLNPSAIDSSKLIGDTTHQVSYVDQMACDDDLPLLMECSDDISDGEYYAF